MDTFITSLRNRKGPAFHIPGFDPGNGNAAAKYLLLLEAPGPGAVASGIVSLDNSDLTARNLARQLREAGVERQEIVLWNIVPWYLGDSQLSAIRTSNAAEIAEGVTCLLQLLQRLPRVEAIVLFGDAARKAFLPLSRQSHARLLTCHHPSARSMNSARTRCTENVDVLKNMKRLVDAPSSLGTARFG